MGATVGRPVGGVNVYGWRLSQDGAGATTRSAGSRSSGFRELLRDMTLSVSTPVRTEHAQRRHDADRQVWFMR